MSVTTTNLIQGPAIIYAAPFGSTEPATISTLPATPFADLGGTMDGLELEVADSYNNLTVDQLVMSPGTTRSERKVTLKTNLAEATLKNLALAISNSDPVTNVLSLDDGLDNGGFTPKYLAIIMDGIAPGGFRRRVKIRKALNTDKAASAYKKDEQTVIPVAFEAFYVSSAIRAVTWEDATA